MKKIIAYCMLLIFPFYVHSQSVIAEKSDTSSAKPKATYMSIKKGDIEIDLCIIEEGWFKMGTDDFKDAKPHAVGLNSFAIMKYEVTVKDFKVFVDAENYKTSAEKKRKSRTWNGEKWKKIKGVNWRHDFAGNLLDENNLNKPVVHVSWADAVAYAKWLSKKTGQTWRLPTEAEWEYAAKGGQNYKYSGSDSIVDVGWCHGTTETFGPHNVGEKKPNAYGVFDMSGNVWEYCSDGYWDKYYEYSPKENPQGPTFEIAGNLKVIRGGCWLNHESKCRVDYRFWKYAGSNVVNTSGYQGFRLVMSN